VNRRRSEGSGRPLSAIGELDGEGACVLLNPGRAVVCNFPYIPSPDTLTKKHPSIHAKPKLPYQW
jgi:hypothetical protein